MFGFINKRKLLKDITIFFLIRLVFIFPQEWRACIGVTDGGTIIQDGNEKIILIGVDTPELAHPKNLFNFLLREFPFR